MIKTNKGEKDATFIFCHTSFGNMVYATYHNDNINIRNHRMYKKTNQERKNT